MTFQEHIYMYIRFRLSSLTWTYQSWAYLGCCHVWRVCNDLCFISICHEIACFCPVTCWQLTSTLKYLLFGIAKEETRHRIVINVYPWVSANKEYWWTVHGVSGVGVMVIYNYWTLSEGISEWETECGTLRRAGRSTTSTRKAGADAFHNLVLNNRRITLHGFWGNCRLL